MFGGWGGLWTPKKEENVLVQTASGFEGGQRWDGRRVGGREGGAPGRRLNDRTSGRDGRL